MHKSTFALLFAVAACSRGNTGRSTDSAAGDVAQNPPTRAARLTSIEGTVSLEAAGAKTWTQPTDNYTVATGDRLYAGSNGRAELDMGDGAVLLDHGGDVTVSNLADNFTQLALDQGALEASLYRYDNGDSLEFDTPNGALIPAAAGTYIVSVEPNGGGTVVSVERGTLEVTGPGLDQTLNAGQTVRLIGTNPIQVVALGASYGQSQPVFSDLDSWRARRDPLYASTSYSSRYVSPSIPGWEDLDANGVWFSDASNANVWCPTHVSRTWVPYRDGRWSWVRPWGWTWVEDEPWGYAPFHYGRWETVTSSDCGSGWAWVPGPVVAQPIWAPALVAFATADALGLNEGSDVEAWFPLGPSEPYFPWYRYSNDYLHDVNATNLVEVRDVDPLIRDRDFNRFRWVNRERAFTAVPAFAFTSGDPVPRHELTVRPSRAELARVIARPSADPRPELVAGGARAATPRVAERPRQVVTRASAREAGQQREFAQRAPNVPSSNNARGVAVAPPRGARQQPGPVIARNEARGAPRHEQAPAAGEVNLPPAHASRIPTPQPEQPQRIQPQRAQPQRGRSAPSAAPQPRAQPSRRPPQPNQAESRPRAEPMTRSQPAPQVAPRQPQRAARPAPQQRKPQAQPQRQPQAQPQRTAQPQRQPQPQRAAQPQRQPQRQPQGKQRQPPPSAGRGSQPAQPAQQEPKKHGKPGGQG